MGTYVEIAVHSPAGDVTVHQELHWTIVGRDPVLDVHDLLATASEQIHAAYSVERKPKPTMPL